MLLAYNPHPDFGYVGSPRSCRKLGLVLAFIVVGLVAGASGVTIFNSYPDPDPMNAMALAPPKALNSTAHSTVTEIAENNSGKGEFALETGAIKPRCYKNAAEHFGGDCIAGQKRRLRSILAINERPAIAAVPIGHRDDPTVLPPEPAAPVVAALPEGAESATPTEATPSTEPTPPTPPSAVTPAKTRERHRERARRREVYRAPRHERREYASTPRYYSNTAYRGGWGGLW